MEIEQIAQINEIEKKHIEEDISKIKEIVRQIHSDSEAMEQAHELAIAP